MAQLRPLAEVLHAETYDQNQRIGILPFYTSVAARRLPAASYVALLQSLQVVYDTFEQVVAQSNFPALRAIWDQHLHKSALLQHDCAALAGVARPEAPAVTLQATVMAEQIRVCATHDPLALVGTAYILAIWNMGGPALCEQLQQNLHLDGMAGLTFLASFDTWGQAHWPAFAANLNAAPLDGEAALRAVRAAQELLSGLDRLIDLLCPLSESTTSQMVTLLNPLAGNHKIPDDLREVQAALRAGERTVQLFPYYERRYGQRGRKFTWSDSGWLVTLAEESQSSANQQIQWLSRLLSTRGMPQWLMECHLLMLHEELVAAIPERRDTYATLYEAAKTLADQRHAHLSDELMMELDRAFAARVGPEWSGWLPYAGAMLAAAVADDLAGVARAVASIESWMTDPTRFPAHWVAAVEATLSAARQQIH